MGGFTLRSEWTIEDIEKAWEQVKKAAEKYGLEYYEPDIRIVTADQMLDAYSSHGLPNLYNHWSFGKSFIENERDYKRGRSGLAYEMIINSNPSIAYLMENNSLLMQYLTLAHACLHGDTEFLTPGGWKKISEYTEGDKVLQIDRKGNSSFVLPEKYHKYKGKLLDIHTARVSQRVTLNHRLPLIKPKKGLEIVTAEEFLENHNSKTRGSLWEFQRTFKAPNTLGLPFSDNELRLDVAIKADGSLYPRTDSGHPCCVSYNRVRFHLKKQRKIERLENLLNLLNMEYTKKPTYEGRVSITFNLDRKIEKTYSKSYYRASPSQLKIIVEEMQHWDGTSHNFSSQYKTDCDFIQYALAACGKGSTLNRGTRCWTVSFSDKKTASCNSHRKKYEFEMLPEQDVYCFTVPTGMFLIRDRNRITVTGNSIGHSAFFRMNYMFKDRTDADFIIPYLKFARKFIAQCEKEYGVEKVEKLLDACHALKWYGIHKYKKPKTKTAQQIKERERFRLETERLAYNKIFENTKKPKQTKKRSKPFGNRFDFPYDNILYFIEKNSPSLAPWEKEIVRITRTLSEYFYPQMSTKCVDSETEYLTPSGWKKIRDFCEGDYVAVFDAKTKEHRFEQPSKYVVNSNSKFIRFKNTRNDQVVTPEHRIVYQEKRSGKIVSREAVDLLNVNKNYYLTLNTFKGIKHKNLSKQEELMLRLYVAFKADGSHNTPEKNQRETSSAVHRFGFKKERKIQRLEKLLNEAGISYRKVRHDSSPDTVNFYTNIVGATKRYDGRYDELSIEEAQIIFDELFYWDGCKSTLTYRSIYKEDVDFIQYVGSLLGYRGTVVRYRNSSGFKSDSQVFSVKFSTQNTSRLGEPEHYTPKDTRSFCFTVSTGMWISRRSGKISVTGNCLNEGFASFMHYHLVYDLFDEDIIDEGGLLEFLSSHCAVCCQYDYTKTTRLNPYTLGFKILMDVKRMCQKPDDEDKRLFPDIVNTDWLETIKDIVQNYRDESFIRQFLSPKVVKDLKLFEIVDDTDSSEIVIRSTQQDSDFKRLRNSLADQYVFSNWFPVVEVIGVAKSNFCLILKHFPQRGAQLDYDSEGYYQFVAALRSLWGHPIEIREAQRF